MLDNVFSFLGRDASLLPEDFRKLVTYGTRHVRSIATDVKVRLVVLDQVVDFFCMFFQAVLDVDLVVLFARECGDELEGGAEIGSELLDLVSVTYHDGYVRGGTAYIPLILI